MHRGNAVQGRKLCSSKYCTWLFLPVSCLMQSYQGYAGCVALQGSQRLHAVLFTVLHRCPKNAGGLHIFTVCMRSASALGSVSQQHMLSRCVTLKNVSAGSSKADLSATSYPDRCMPVCTGTYLCCISLACKNELNRWLATLDSSWICVMPCVYLHLVGAAHLFGMSVVCIPCVAPDVHVRAQNREGLQMSVTDNA